MCLSYCRNQGTWKIKAAQPQTLIHSNMNELGEITNEEFKIMTVKNAQWNKKIDTKSWMNLKRIQTKAEWNKEVKTGYENKFNKVIETLTEMKISMSQEKSPVWCFINRTDQVKDRTAVLKVKWMTLNNYITVQIELKSMNRIVDIYGMPYDYMNHGYRRVWAKAMENVFNKIEAENFCNLEEKIVTQT